MSNYIKYDELDVTDTICPLLSLKLIQWNGNVAKCLGNQCQFWKFCETYTMSPVKIYGRETDEHTD